MKTNIHFINQSILCELENYFSKPIDLKTEVTTPEIEIKNSSIEDYNMFNPVFRSVIKDFIVILTKNFPREDLKNFYNNINGLKLKTKKLREASAHYKIDKNEIEVEKDLKPSSINGILFHELFHMASSTYANGRRYSGFSQRTKSTKKIIGNGINEGYTELLAHRYYPQIFKYSYVEECGIVLHLEDIIGKEEMSKLYLNADLNGLINKLREYTKDEDILEFITSVDQIQDYYLKKSTKIEFLYNIKKAYRFILRAYIKKQEIEYSNGKISKQEFINKVGEYIYLIKQTSHTDKNNYITQFEVIEILESVLGENEVNANITQKVYSMYSERA